MAVDTKLNSASRTMNIKISGRFDLSTHKSLRQASKQAETGVDKIVVDLGLVEYIDSSALGMLLILKHQVDDNKKAVRILNVKPDVMKVFETANFHYLFTFE